MQLDINRRFGGVIRLYGEAGFARLQTAHIAVIGVGGVGSWAAEALARNGVGALTLIDLDNVAESNINRQLHALDDTLGKAKISAMAERLLQINPLLNITLIEDFISPDNVAAMLNTTLTAVLDAMDDAAAKTALVAYCHAQKIPLVVTGGAGGRLDPTAIHYADLAHVQGDRLLAKVRNQLRRDYGFPAGSQSKKASPKFGVACVYSNEPVQDPIAACDAPAAASGVTGLNCAGYGSSVCVTAPFGFAAAASLLKKIAAPAA